MAFSWKVVHGGKTPPPGEVVKPDERLSWGRTVGIGAQHVVAMFGATFVFPLVMGLDPNVAIMMSGIATILFLLIVQNRVPSYLGTSASFVAGVAAIRAAGGDNATVTGAILVAGLVLAAVGLVINFIGIQIIHQPAAHTDGDVIVFFRRGDVIATGDVIDTTRFPFIDVERGGTLQGELDALNRLMDLSIHNVPLLWYPDRTFLVPGHGHVYDKLDLLEYRDAITVVRDRVQDLIDQGLTLAQVQAANPTLGYRSQYGTDSGPWTTEMFVAAVYNELAAKKNEP